VGVQLRAAFRATGGSGEAGRSESGDARAAGRSRFHNASAARGTFDECRACGGLDAGVRLRDGGEQPEAGFAGAGAGVGRQPGFEPAGAPDTDQLGNDSRPGGKRNALRRGHQRRCRGREGDDRQGAALRGRAAFAPDLVASGRVAQRALQKHGLINDDNKGIFTYAQTDALVLGVVQKEQADAVFVYKTDAAKMTLRGFDIVDIKTEDAPPIFYTAAVCRASKNQTMARAFIDYCSSEAAKPVWAKYGFETN